MRNREGMGKKIRRALELDELSFTGDMLEMRGRRDLTVSGVGGFLHYGESEIKLSLREHILKIEGEELYCRSYLGGVVRVSGEISSISFEKRGVKK